MTKIFHAILFLLSSSLLISKALANVSPKENAALNYTNIYFEEDMVANASAYQLFIYTDSSLKKLLFSTESEFPAFWKNELNWGQTYYWKISALDKKKIIKDGMLRRFSIIRLPFKDCDTTFLNVITDNENAGGYIFFDDTRNLYNRKGIPVWTLPKINGIGEKEIMIKKTRCFNYTKDGTITFLNEPTGYEISMDGEVLWKTPSPFVYEGDTVSFHHDLKKLPDGTYMVLGNRKKVMPVPDGYDTQALMNDADVLKKNGKYFKECEIGMVLLFNYEGKLLWDWDAAKYITLEDLNYKKMPNNIPIYSSHINAFSVSEDGKWVYAGFRDLSRIVKINKATRQVVASYGEKYPSGDAKYGNQLFQAQHDAGITRRNSIFILNNKDPRSKGASEALEISESPAGNETDIKLLWNFSFDFDTLSNGKSQRGGNITELPNGNLLICAGALNRVFEVTRDKKVVWDVFAMQKKKETPASPLPQYRTFWTEKISFPAFLVSVPPGIKNDVNELNIPMTLYNSGNISDSYQIVILSEDRKVLYKSVSTEIAPGKKDFINIKLKKENYKSVILNISSTNKQSLRRKTVVKIF